MDTTTTGRGIVLYTKKTLIANLEVIETPFQEAILCEINLKNKIPFLLDEYTESPI